MHSDLATLENLATKVPYQTLENILKKSRTNTYNTILSKFNKWLLNKFQTDFVCSKIHLCGVLQESTTDCSGDNQDCSQPTLRFEGYNKKLCISVWFEDVQNNDYESHRLNCISLTQKTFSPKGRIRNTRIVRQWNEESLGSDDGKIHLIEYDSELYDHKYWESQLSPDTIQNAVEFCQYLCGTLFEPLSEEEFDKRQHTTPIGIMIEYIYDLHDEFVFLPIYYIKEAMYTILAIYQFRKDSIIATLPKDIVKIIVREVWNTKDDSVWF